jgi:antitoxin (DNA-binding transcriptional repressor) of toxin-antitoxin stability system
MYTWIMDVTITEFRRQCMTLLEDLPEEGVVVTKRGQAIARVTSVTARRKGKLITTTLYPGKGKPGPRALDRETPYDLVLD